ncbi:MAG: murein L,D-transpeptidase catalytic domain-containing protein [Bacteroidia bacterium]
MKLIKNLLFEYFPERSRRAKAGGFLLLLLTGISGFTTTDETTTRLKTKSREAGSFCKTKGYNTEFCILIDMTIHSGKKRAFLYDLKKDSVLASGMCAHGCGANPWASTYTKDKPVFSNVPDSHCSSLGKFMIGKRGYSNWGIKVNYILNGLEPTNSNAKKREIVLHSWEDVSDTEIYPEGVPEGWGCPAVSNAFMKVVDPCLRASSKPVLLWIYNWVTG